MEAFLVVAYTRVFLLSDTVDYFCKAFRRALRCVLYFLGGGGGVNVTVRCAAVRVCFVKNRTVRLGTGLRRLTGQMSNIAIIAREFFLQHDDAGEENRRQCPWQS